MAGFIYYLGRQRPAIASSCRVADQKPDPKNQKVRRATDVGGPIFRPGCQYAAKRSASPALTGIVLPAPLVVSGPSSSSRSVEHLRQAPGLASTCSALCQRANVVHAGRGIRHDALVAIIGSGPGRRASTIFAVEQPVRVLASRTSFCPGFFAYRRRRANSPLIDGSRQRRYRHPSAVIHLAKNLSGCDRRPERWLARTVPAGTTPLNKERISGCWSRVNGVKAAGASPGPSVPLQPVRGFSSRSRRTEAASTRNAQVPVSARS